MTKPIKEPKVKRAVQRYLARKGYIYVDSREQHETGADLIMRGRHNGRYVTVEAKGETGAKSKQDNKIIHAIGQIVTKFRRHPNYFHGLAFPIGWKQRVGKKINRDAMVALNLVVYLVRDNGKVLEVNRQRYRAVFGKDADVE